MIKHLAFWLLNICCFSLAAAISFEVETDKDDPVSYSVGETVIFQIKVLDNKQPVSGITVRWNCQADQAKKMEGSFISSAEKPEILQVKALTPGFIRLRLTAVDKDGKSVLAKFDGGAGIEPGKLVRTAEPETFDEFWYTQKKRLQESPAKPVYTAYATKDKNVSGWDVSADCPGGAPLSGRLFKPAGAKNGKHPAIIIFHGYGVRSSGNNEYWAKRNMISLDINAHGLPNGKSKAFYSEIADGKLKGYGFHGNKTPESSYFCGMILRALRAAEIVKMQPEWDGKNLIVFGGSQGGFQALLVAALDEDVTFCAANAPWLCDLAGFKQGRISGWRPAYTPALSFFDPVNHAPRIKAETVIDIGLGDYVCPPSGITILYNSITAPKKLIYIQGGTHGVNPHGTRDTVEKSLLRYLEKILSE